MHVQTDEHRQHLDASLINPFVGKSPEEMEQLIEAFMDTTGIENIWRPYIHRGAFLAQDRDAFTRSRPDQLQLEQDEVDALLQEDLKAGSRWDQPWILYALVACCSLGAAVQGWDEVGGSQCRSRWS